MNEWFRSLEPGERASFDQTYQELKDVVDLLEQLDAPSESDDAVTAVTLVNGPIIDAVVGLGGAEPHIQYGACLALAGEMLRRLLKDKARAGRC